MDKAEKGQAIEELKSRFQQASVTLLADYKGLKVSELTQLRRELRNSAAELKVLKNTLAVLALKDTEMAPLSEFFVGTTAVVTTLGDPVSPAKVLVKFAKDFEKAQIKMGFMSGKLLKPAEIEALSKLPSREEMLAKMLGSMKAPAQNMLNVLVAIPRQLVTVLAAVRDTKSA
jgi:large subunit ribosomal protein L10